MAMSFLSGTAAGFTFACPFAFTFYAIFSDLSLAIALRATDGHSSLLNSAFPQALVAVEFHYSRAFALIAVHLSLTLTIIAFHTDPSS